jgi:dCMP deaminase
MDRNCIDEKIGADKIEDPYADLIFRPQWDEYYLTMAFVVAQRSFDPSSKCGSVIVSKDNRVLSTGYNGPIKGSNDNEIPLDRPRKYCHMIHGEENALLAYNGSHQDIQGATIFVTGRPCHRCLRMLLQKGVTRIIYGPNVTKLVDQADIDAQEIMLKNRNIEIKEIDFNLIMSLLEKTFWYIEKKSKEVKNY